jgi:hypothetical protein
VKNVVGFGSTFALARQPGLEAADGEREDVV